MLLRSTQVTALVQRRIALEWQFAQRSCHNQVLRVTYAADLMDGRNELEDVHSSNNMRIEFQNKLEIVHISR